MFFLDIQEKLLKINSILLFLEKRCSLLELQRRFRHKLALPKFLKTPPKRLVLEHYQEQEDELRKLGQIEDSNEDLYERLRVRLVAVDQLNDIDGQNCHIVKRIPQYVVGQDLRLFVLFVTQAHRVRHMSPEIPNRK